MIVLLGSLWSGATATGRGGGRRGGGPRIDDRCPAISNGGGESSAGGEERSAGISNRGEGVHHSLMEEGDGFQQSMREEEEEEEKEEEDVGVVQTQMKEEGVQRSPTVVNDVI